LLLVLLIDDIPTLVDVFIANPTRAYLVSRAIISHGVDASLVAQVKEKFHCNHYLVDVFLPLAMEVFGRLH
jgi:hypothetical protein